VRRAAYWSVLVAPTAGVTYGANGVWPWSEVPDVPLGHPSIGTVLPWHEAAALPGSRQMTILRDLFESLDWTGLRPAQEVLASQPGERDPNLFVAAAASADRSLTVIYLPAGRGGEGSVREVSLREGTVPPGAAASWFDPRTGTRSSAAASEGARFTSPGEGDWVLLIEKSAAT
jgi:hypothetical protein